MPAGPGVSSVARVQGEIQLEHVDPRLAKDTESPALRGSGDGVPHLCSRQPARANIRRHMKRLLRRYGYPPNLEDAAVKNVLQQAEAVLAEWAA